MADIRVLSTHVANLIAAGEVVERPASAAKELVENAVDAGSKSITVEIKSGGIEYLRVTDDGCGISAEDAPTAFMRHSTSKIREEEDLSHIGTLGFRGEALAAIASVSKVDMLTKKRDSQLGISLHIESGEVKDISEAGCPDGTTIVVRNLFYNTPARMKFLKRDVAEAAAVEAVVQAAALSHPEIAFKFIRDGKQTINTPGDNDLKTCIYSVLGRDVATGMLEAKSRGDVIGVNGFVSKPICSRGNRMMQYFFVNGRYIKSRLLSAAVDEAYKDCLMKGRYPACVMFIEMPLEFVDVNVHPAKTEVKFVRDHDVFEAVYFAVKGGLSLDNGRTAAQFDEKPIKQEINTVEPEVSKPAVVENTAPAVIAPEPKSESKPKPESIIHSHTESVSFENNLKKKVDFKDLRVNDNVLPLQNNNIMEEDTQEVIDEITQETQEHFSLECEPAADTSAQDDAVVVENETVLEPITQEYRVVGEILNTYIIIEQEDSVLLVDKHAAHERIIFNRLKSVTGDVQSQLFITPVIVNLTRREAVAVIEYKDELLKLGFDFDEFGEDSIAVRQVPDGIDEGETVAIISDISQALLDGRVPTSLEKLDAVCHSVACKAAIKAGKKSDFLELKKIADQVMIDPEIRYCPHGRPVTVEMTRYQLEKQFKRVT